MAIQSHEFRWRAKESLSRAKKELQSSDGARLRYAALELRDAMEALVYDRVLAFKDDIPPEQYKTWQPRKVMGLLIQIDPTIDLACTLAFGVETEIGTPAPPEAMKVMGTDTPLSLKNLKDHYDALGSYLHMPSLEQVMTGHVPDLKKLRTRCDEIVSILETILSSTIWNLTLGAYATLPECANDECRKPIKRRLPADRTQIETHCFSCNAEYTIQYGAGDDKIIWTPKKEKVNCSNEDCSAEMFLWLHEIKPGTWWTCYKCGIKNQIVLSLITKSQTAGGAEKPDF